jgi:site-specific recombinase XerD
MTSEHTAHFLKHRERRRRLTTADSAALKRLMELLLRVGAISVRREQLSPVEQCLLVFGQHLRDERGLDPRSIINHCRYVRLFLKERFTDGNVKLGDLRASDVVDFIQHQALPEHRSRSKQIAAAMRAFLHHVFRIGEVDIDLSPAIPRVPNWRMTAIPRAIAPNHVRKVLASCDRRTAMGRRDYAILLLLSRLGLRSTEVISLKLDDIDWKAGTLTVNGKGRRVDRLPLPPDIGRAIVAYLQHGRPKSASRHLFLRTVAPFNGFRGPASLTSVIVRALQRANIEDSPSKGTHQFRFGLASEMLRKGASINEIGHVLRHRLAQTTMIYTKIDVRSLRELAVRWPGGVQ